MRRAIGPILFGLFAVWLIGKQRSRRRARDGRILVGMIEDTFDRKRDKIKAQELAGSLSKEDAEALRRTAEEIREGIGARMKELVNEGRKY